MCMCDIRTRRSKVLAGAGNWFGEKRSLYSSRTQGDGNYYWPALDVDLTKEMIEHPENFPLRSKEN